MVNKEVRVENAIITSAYLGEEHGCLTLRLMLKGDGWECGYGGYVLGKWFTDVHKPNRTAGAIVELLKTLGLKEFNQLEGTLVRVGLTGWGEGIQAIGHVIENKWFGFDEYFKKYSEDNGSEAEVAYTNANDLK